MSQSTQKIAEEARSYSQPGVNDRRRKVEKKIYSQSAHVIETVGQLSDGTGWQVRRQAGVENKRYRARGYISGKKCNKSTH